MLYVGGGVGMAKATQAVKKFLQITKMPSVSTLKGLGSIDPTDPVYMGMIGMHGTRPANIAVHECDLLLVCGARFDDRVTGKLDSFCTTSLKSFIVILMLRKLTNSVLLMSPFKVI